MTTLPEKENFEKTFMTLSGEFSSNNLTEGVTEYVFLQEPTIRDNFLVDQSTGSSAFFWDATFKVLDIKTLQADENVPKPLKVYTRICTGEPDVQIVKKTSSAGIVTYSAEPFGGLNLGGEKNNSCMRRKVLSDLPKTSRPIYASSLTLNNKSSVRVVAVQQFGSVMESVIKSNTESDATGEFYSDQTETREFISDLDDVSLPIDYGNAKIDNYNTAAESSVAGSFVFFSLLVLFIIWRVRRKIKNGPNNTGWIRNQEGLIYTAKDFSWWKPWNWDKKIAAKFVDSNPVKFYTKEGENFIIIPPQNSGGFRYGKLLKDNTKEETTIGDMNTNLGWSQPEENSDNNVVYGNAANKVDNKQNSKLNTQTNDVNQNQLDQKPEFKQEVQNKEFQNQVVQNQETTNYVEETAEQLPEKKNVVFKTMIENEEGKYSDFKFVNGLVGTPDPNGKDPKLWAFLNQINLAMLVLIGALIAGALLTAAVESIPGVGAALGWLGMSDFLGIIVILALSGVVALFWFFAMVSCIPQLGYFVRSGIIWALFLPAIAVIVYVLTVLSSIVSIEAKTAWVGVGVIAGLLLIRCLAMTWRPFTKSKNPKSKSKKSNSKENKSDDLEIIKSEITTSADQELQ